jgi:hypothetical protein
MPIAINGSGTITGVSAGGLPDASIVTADIVDGAITQAKRSEQLTLGSPQASTSGTSIDFTGIPSWVKRITVMFNGVSTSGTSLLVVRLGTSGGVVSSGYNGAASSVGSTVVSQLWLSGFGLRGATTAAANIYGGHMLLSLINGNDWVSSHSMSLSDTPVSFFGSGFVSLGGTLDQVRITTVGGTNTFDAGTINIMYE